MTIDPMPEPEGPEDERFVYAVTAAGVEAARQSAVEFNSEREVPRAAGGIGLDPTHPGVLDGGGSARAARRRGESVPAARRD